MAKKIKKIQEIIEESKKEIAPGVTSEKLSPMFFDHQALKHQPEIIYRLDSNNHRYYYRFVNDEPVFYTSVTTLIKNTLPTPPQLITWMMNKGADGPGEAESRANYGTFLHMQCGELLINGTYDLDKLPDKLKDFCVQNKIPMMEEWISELKKDVLAFAQFMIERNVKPLAIEIILYHPEDGYAGAIDIVCEVDDEEKGFFGETYASGANKGKPKESKRTIRVRAIVDIKSGRKGFYESSEIQLKGYETMFNIHFPETPINRLYNWSPKEWRATPSYNLKDQTNNRSAKKLPYLVALAKIEDGKRDNSVTVLSGIIDFAKGLGVNITEKTLIDLVKERK